MFDKNFTEAIQAVLNHEGCAVGENFKPGMFLDCEKGVVVMKARQDRIKTVTIGNALICQSMLDQKYEIIEVATNLALGLISK